MRNFNFCKVDVFSKMDKNFEFFFCHSFVYGQRCFVPKIHKNWPYRFGDIATIPSKTWFFTIFTFLSFLTKVFGPAWVQSQCTFPMCTAETEGFGKLISSLNMKQRGGQIKNIENEFENCVLSICVSLMKKVLALFENKFSSFRNVSSKVPKQDLLTNRLF